MNNRALILGTAWTLSLGAAYFIGNGSSDPAPEPTSSPNRTAAASSKSNRTTPGSSTTSSSARKSSSSSAGLRIVADRDPRVAVMELSALTDPIARVQGFLALVDSLGPNEFLDVVKDFRSTGMQGDERRTEYAILLHAWGRSDPESALAYTIENTGTQFARQTVLSSWSSYDPDAAIAFAEANHEGERANPLMVGVIKGIVGDDLNRATTLLQTLPRSGERGDALSAMIPHLLAEGVDNAIIWSNGITDEALRSGALSFIARDIAEDNPAQAAEILMTATDENSRLRAVDNIAEAWARQDLDAAIAFAEDLDPKLRAEAAEGVVGQMVGKDPIRASQWMESLAASGTNIDSSIRTFAWRAISDEPELVANWIGQMEDTRHSERTYHQILGRWVSNDPEAARAWIANTELPESVQRRFTRQPEQNGR